VSVCHCGQCRRWHGHAGAYTAADKSRFRLTEQRGLRWFRSSDFAQRGFCAECGSSLFYQHDKANYVAIAAGSLDDSKGLKTVQHIFVAHRGAYEHLDDGLPQRPEGM
jgi:hypothetical protein